MKKLFDLIRRIVELYTNKQIPLASAALCYYMTMTFFPLIICLYTLLGHNYEQATAILNFGEQFLSPGTLKTVRSFLTYVENNHSTGMLYAGALLMLTSASAAVRSMQVTIGRMQGGRRFIGVIGILFSLVFSVVFLVAIYFAILVIFTGREMLARLNALIPFLDIGVSWTWIRYLLLSGLMFLIFWGIYRVSRAKGAAYSTWAGALLSTVGSVVMSMIFSRFIAVSSRYSVVYGSLASVILLMYWLFLFCQILYIGAAFNLALHEVRKEKT